MGTYGLFMRIYHFEIHKVYYETHSLFSSTKLQIYDKNNCEQVKVILLYTSDMELNAFLFGRTKRRIWHSIVAQDQVAFTYIHIVAQ